MESEAAFGLLGAAARAALPYLQKALADKRGDRPEAVRRRRQDENHRRACRFPEGHGTGVKVDASVDDAAL